jgi:hypothetical protein
MAQYKVYLVKDKHFIAPLNLIEAACDTEALKQAESLVDGYDAELWQGERLVKALPAKSNRLPQLAPSLNPSGLV